MDQLREKWLNPPELVHEVRDAPHLPPRMEAVDKAAERELKKRTLTNLYNLNPAWLEGAHKALDEAVAKAYGWPVDASDEQILELLLAENIRREKLVGSSTSGSDDDDDEVDEVDE